MAYKTPGVYVKEISIFPPSVAEVETAVPALIGYTEKAVKKGVDLTNIPTRISSLLEFEQYFGAGNSVDDIIVTLDDANVPQQVRIVPNFYMYDSLRLFYDNGGGDAYIISIGNYDDDIDAADFNIGLAALKKYDEPTIILFPDAVLLDNANDLFSLQAAALRQSEELMDRVAVLDVPPVPEDGSDLDDVVGAFRSSIGTRGLRYGAAYMPFLRTTLKPSFDYEVLTLKRYRTLNPGETLNDLDDVNLADVSSGQARTDVQNLMSAIVDRDAVSAFLANPLNTGDDLPAGYAGIGATDDEAEVSARLDYLVDVITAASGLTLSNTELQSKLDDLSDNRLRALFTELLQIEADYNDLLNGGADLDVASANDPFAPNLPASSAQAAADSAFGDPAVIANSRSAFQSLFDQLSADLNAFLDEVVNEIENREEDLTSSNAIYAAIVDAIEKEGSVLPPSGAVAGLYAYVDNTRGVWKAPANVSLSSVVGPTIVIDDRDQESLNVDPTSGKSINAIRSFVGRGPLVWGARTLAGNDNEWRYVPVRRFFNMVEESVKKSTSWAVFEPNTANTWTRVKTMIDNYLIQKWREGALAGAKPDEAFFVKVGLGLTMTAQDILEGRMIVEIGMAVVRPAEFIILKFSHKLQES